MSPTIEPAGDAAALARLADADTARALAARLVAHAPPWLEDVVPAYATVGIHFDPTRITPAAARDWLRDQAAALLAGPTPEPGPTHVIPCCYDRGPDLAAVADRLRLTPATVAAAHVAVTYTVRAVGFVPGFPYLGELPDALAGVPRLPTPRVRVVAGSVGLTGRQTGVYPLPRPGGWPLIGQTPLVLVDVAASFFPMRVGDRVRFTRIGDAEFRRLAGSRLANPARPPEPPEAGGVGVR